jgi:subtilisin family serine protease
MIKGLYYKESDYFYEGRRLINNVIAEAIRYAVDRKARIINLSFTLEIAQPAIVDALKYAAEHDVLVFAAAGNAGGGSPLFPASHPLAVGVGNAYSQYSQLALTSNEAGRGRKDFFTAPGEFVLSTTPNNTYQKKSGTSMATPFVAGVAARMLSANPNLTKDQVLDILANTASHLPLPMLANSADVNKATKDPGLAPLETTSHSLQVGLPSPPQRGVVNETTSADVQVAQSVASSGGAPNAQSREYLAQAFATMLGLIALSTLLAQTTETEPPKNGKRLVE